MAQLVKNLPAMQETWVQFLGWEDGPEEGMATHSSILAWEIPWTEEPGGLYSPWGCKELDTTERLSLSLFTYNISLSLYVNLYLEFTSILAVSGGGIFFYKNSLVLRWEKLARILIFFYLLFLNYFFLFTRFNLRHCPFLYFPT